MWICLNNGFFSVVEHRQKEGYVMVRARNREHLENIFPIEEIEETQAADYQWRITIPKATMAAAISSQIMSVNYDNFKNSVIDMQLHHCYSQFWGIMNSYQYSQGIDEDGDNPNNGLYYDGIEMEVE